MELDKEVSDYFNTGIPIQGSKDSNKITVSFEWISVKDRLPESYTTILIYGQATRCSCSKDFKVREGRYKEHGDFEFGEYDCPCNVTHWMPLPEPPNE